MLDQNDSNIIANLTICRHGPLLKIVSKIYCIILVKKVVDQIRFNYDGRFNYLWVWASSDNRIK